MNQVISGPSNLSNSSSSDSINSFSFFSSFNSSISTKFSLLNRDLSNNSQQYSAFQKSNYLSDFEDSISPQTMAAMSRIQRRKKKQQQQQQQAAAASAANPTERLSVTLHTSDSDFTKTRRRRPEFDRQKSISRWMADTLSSKCGKIRRSLSSHETLTRLSMSKRSLHGSSEHAENKSKKNAAFRFFPRGDFSRSMHKPVRKPSSGPEGLIEDVLMALGGQDSTHKTQKGSSFSLNVSFLGSPDEFPDDLDIEDSDSDNEEDEFGGSTDFHSAEFKAPPPLLSGRNRWDASSPSRKEEPQKDSPPKNACNSNSRRSSRTMPILPPPPFTPVKNSVGKVDGTEMLNSAFAPLAAAAIAIATEGVGEVIEEEEGVLNDMNDMNDSIRVHHRSDHTDGAMANSICTWNDSISMDGVSLVSASNASIPYWTQRSNSSLGPLGSALERLNEEDAHQRRNDKDMSYKSSADDTYESGYTFHHDVNDSPAQSLTRPRFPHTKSNSEHTRMLAPLIEPPLTPLRDASIVPPAMPRRSISNHYDSNSDSIPMASPADRLKYLLNHSDKRYGRRSSMPNGSCGVDGGSDHSNSMSMRRASLDSSSHHVRSSTHRRRCSLDSSTNHSRLRAMRRNSMDSSTHSSSRDDSHRSIPYPPSLEEMATPPMSRFTRMSPAIGGAQRKRMSDKNNNNTIPSNPSF